uniref:Uncharacterized protein n=1 Tax=Haptolina ericina TaxID=156174 RepID=A0A7S3FKK9_9EUKA
MTGLQHTGPFGSAHFIDCGQGCLFDIVSDEAEMHNLANSTNATHAAALQQLKARMAEVRETVYAPERGDLDPAACEANQKHGGYWSPWLPSPPGWPSHL